MESKDQLYGQLLALRCRRGDPGALEELVRSWERRLLFFVRRLATSEEDAWDILQDTWVKVARGVTRLENPASLGPWLYSVARCTAMDHLRSIYAHHAPDEVSDEALTNTPSEPEPEIADAQRVHRALEQISLPHREVLVLHFLEDFSIDETAAILQVPPGTVKSRLHYAKRSLRTVLDQEG